MIFNLLLLIGSFIMIECYDKQANHIEGSDTYKLLQTFFNLGFWMVFTGLLKYIL